MELTEAKKVKFFLIFQIFGKTKLFLAFFGFTTDTAAAAFANKQGKAVYRRSGNDSRNLSFIVLLSFLERSKVYLNSKRMLIITGKLQHLYFSI
jgi:hypothetical protein